LGYIESQNITIGSDGFDSAFVAIKSEQVDAFLMSADPLHQFSIVRIIDFLANNRLPAMYQMRASRPISPGLDPERNWLQSRDRCEDCQADKRLNERAND
jgi:hypothetical protein